MKKLTDEYRHKKILHLFSNSEKVGDCFEWTLYLDTNGYGSTNIGKKNINTHRAMFWCFYGFSPDKFVVCHKCDNRKCINPYHLFLGTQKTNILDCVEKGRHKNQNTRKIFCKNGHDLSSDEHLRIDSTGFRRCKTCQKEYQTKWKENNNVKRNN